jgi:hypothetical protein
MKALKYLSKTMLYKLENVKIDDNWKQVFIENKEAYDSESETNNVEYNEDDNEDIDEPITKTLVHGLNKEAYDSESETNNVEYNEDDNEDIDEPITKKLVHGFTDAHTTYDLANKKINIAPAAG